MWPLIILASSIIITTAIATYRDSFYDRWDSFSFSFVLNMFIFGLLYVLSQLIGMAINTYEIPEHHETRIVSLQDGSQIHGDFSGGLFLSRGSIDQVEYFSYYKDNGDGSYSLEKQIASASVIIPDATPETARLVSDSVLIHCEYKWWSTWCSPDRGEYRRGEFHVPANSIKNDFVLDAS